MLNLPLIGLWVQVLKVPYSILAPLIVILCQVGAYSILLMNIFGLVGYFMRRYEFSGAPLILGLVLGPMFENSLRRSLMISEGDPMIFLYRPLSSVFLLVAIVLLASPLFSKKRIGAEAIEKQDDEV